MDKILKNLNDFLKSESINKKDIIIVGLSGGMDSMTLFDSLYKLQMDYNYIIVPMHVHHGIRGNEAGRDLSFVDKYVKTFDLKLVKKYVDAKKYAEKERLSLEEAARILRYKEFDKEWEALSKKYPKSNVYIAVAHHMNDLAETIIHNIARGTGVKGLVGIKKVNDHIIRPLLSVDRKDIENYVKEYDIPYVKDSTNDDKNYTRNFIRLELLKDINSKALNHIADISEEAHEIYDFIENETKKLIKNVLIDNNTIDIKKLNLCPNIIKTNIIRDTIERLVGTLKDIGRVHINDIIALSIKKDGGHLDLPYNIVVDKKKNELKFKKTKVNISMKKRKKK